MQLSGRKLNGVEIIFGFPLRWVMKQIGMKSLSVLALAFILLAGSSCTMSYGEPQAAVSQRHINHPWRISAPPGPFQLPPELTNVSIAPRPTPSPAPSPIQDFPSSNSRYQPTVPRDAR